jgi:hypothetical protein
MGWISAPRDRLDRGAFLRIYLALHWGRIYFYGSQRLHLARGLLKTRPPRSSNKLMHGVSINLSRVIVVLPA